MAGLSYDLDLFDIVAISDLVSKSFNYKHAHRHHLHRRRSRQSRCGRPEFDLNHVQHGSGQRMQNMGATEIKSLSIFKTCLVFTQSGPVHV